MHYRYYIIVFISLLYVIPFYPQQKEKDFVYQLTPKDASVNSKTTEKINNGKLLQLKNDIINCGNYKHKRKPDMVFSIIFLNPGTYTISSHVKRIEINVEHVENLYIEMQVGNQRITKRIVSDARNYSNHVLGNFLITEKDKELKIWLPKGIQFEKIQIREYKPVAVPLAAQMFDPFITPPKTHPRLWVNKKTLPLIKARLNDEENSSAWLKVQEWALKKYTFNFSPLQEISFSEDLEKAVEAKAFYYLMTNNKLIGREAVRLMMNYLSVLEYGNVTYGDITRHIGHSIYISSLVYDWCYDLLNETEKKQLYQEMMRLSRSMSIGWPPFKESIVNGHGSEAQINRDLLAMSIAIYEQDSIPYQYTSYLILKELVLMRRFEYQSSRHNQGIDYGAYRHMWEMYAAWLFYRMSEIEIFDENIKNLPLYWLYMRLPNGQLFRDGDVFRESVREGNYYWKQPEMFLLDYSYSNNAVLKGEFLKQGGLPDNPILFLLLNDPNLKAENNYDYFPLALETGAVTGSLISRTGWEISTSSNDVIAEIKGGGYHFGNHQHADAGAIQIYYHGLQVCDLGLYIAYGIPYDFNFNKRSISHSMTLVVDPEESFGKNLINDGGTKFNQKYPKSPFEAQQDEWFNYGTVISSDIGYLNSKFQYSYFKVDLTKAYTSKILNYKKTFCFVNLDREDVPAFIVVLDDITATNSFFKKFWKINTLNKPIVSDSMLVLHNRDEAGVIGKTHIKTLLPAHENRKITYWNSQDTCNFIAPLSIINTRDPESRGYQIVMTPKRENKRDLFLNIFMMTADGIMPLRTDFYEMDDIYFIEISDYIVVMHTKSDFINKPFELTITTNSTRKVILTGLKSGLWNVSCKENNTDFDFKISQNKNSFLFIGKSGSYRILPNEENFTKTHSKIN